MNNQFDYQDLIYRGFEDLKIRDSVIFRRHGYYPVSLIKKLTKKISLEWNTDDRLLYLTRVNYKNGEYLAKKQIHTLKELDETILFFTQTREEYMKRENWKNNRPYNPMLAC